VLALRGEGVGVVVQASVPRGVLKLTVTTNS
jgi:hypothetical protein